MVLKKFRRSEHYDLMCDWLTLHNTYIPTERETPRIGYVAYSDETPVAMAFLRIVEGGHAQLDGLVSNPLATGKKRHLGIDCIITKLIQVARGYGIKSILALSTDESTILRSRSHGFVKLPHTLIAVDISDNQHLC